MRGYFFILSSPATTPGLVDGLLAFGFLGFSAFGLRASRLDFFWPLAMVNTFAAAGMNTRRRTA